MNKSEIATKIKETEEQLASLRKQLEQPEFPTLAESKVGDKLENGCIVVHKFKDLQMALIAAPQSTERSCRWDKEFKEVFDSLVQEGFNPSQWFIPNVEQLKLAIKNCKQRFAGTGYWCSSFANSNGSCGVGRFIGGQVGGSKEIKGCVRAFSLVSY
jgi:hypothetical protein